MNYSKKYLNALAEKWGDAYRADFNGREVSIEIIRATLMIGFSEAQAELIYRSKYIRWFFDSQGDSVPESKAFQLFTNYLKEEEKGIRSMIANEMPLS
jgi:hypothetical protein